MSSQRGNVHRSRPQKHRNAIVFKNDKHDCSSRTKMLNSKSHDGVCQHCKDVLEWRVKFSKYKPLTQPKKCVKCLQKTVKDAYHIICKPCAIQLELCAKCGKKEDIVVPIVKEPQAADNDSTASKKENEMGDEEEEDDLDCGLNLNSSDDDFS
ncbi:uncharacterized protein C9orf85 homolog [Spea bombifrons]|uniref:uncharacterized protein C9orf85 homolog n=1 Tax=Spea bombifrons TaxID=233779 RepID=UPI00234A3205|nr:uncharacterized protein C9orf85 homolog [Spea bombifrons]